VWVFVFDTEHLSPGGVTRARDAVVSFFGERFKEGDLGAIVADGKMVNNRISSDRAELKAAAAAVKASGNESQRMRLQAAEWPRVRDASEAFDIANGDTQALNFAVQRACVDDPPLCKRAPPDMELMEKSREMTAAYKATSRLTLQVLDGLTNGLARVPGQKTIVLFSEGFVVQQQESELRKAIGQAARAGAHFYAIDARGLNTGSGAGIIDQKQSDSVDGPNSLAVDTGGFAIRNENNFARALDEIQRDAGTYYVVSYTPSSALFDGKYRAIDVAVDRPGVKVRARRGYLAVAPALLLRATTPASAASATRVSPKHDADSPRAKADTFDLPVSPGLVALPDETALGDNTAFLTNGSASMTDAVRARIEGGKMVAALSAFAGADRDASFGGTAAADAAAGWSAYEKGDVATAAVHLAEAAKAPDARPWVHYALGLAHFAQGRYKDAAAAWERVLKDAPEFEPIYFSLADAYGLQRNEGTALKVLRDAERRWPADPEVFDAIGVIQIKRGAVDAAIESFTSSTKVAPRVALGWFNLGRALQMRWVRSQRYDKQREAWVGPDEDHKAAAEAFQKYLDLGGPFEAQARQALAALAWK
jgi:VWFA-related protein